MSRPIIMKIALLVNLLKLSKSQFCHLHPSTLSLAAADFCRFSNDIVLQGSIIVYVQFPSYPCPLPVLNVKHTFMFLLHNFGGFFWKHHIIRNEFRNIQACLKTHYLTSKVWKFLNQANEQTNLQTLYEQK